MTAKTSRWTAVGGGVMIVLGAAVGLQACGVDGPLAPEITPPSEVAGSQIPDAPTIEIPVPEVDVAAPELDEPDLPFGEAAGSQAAPPVEAGPTFTPFTVAPSITNRGEVVAAMEAQYPPLLREAAVGGTVRVYFLIGDDGLVKDVRIDNSSGHAALDDAAMRVAQVYRFTPALNRDEKVAVWVSFPITFQVR